MAGLCYLSGTWRLLVPEAAESLLAEMRAGKRAMKPGRGKQLDLVCEVRARPSQFTVSKEKRMDFEINLTAQEVWGLRAAIAAINRLAPDAALVERDQDGDSGLLMLATDQPGVQIHLRAIAISAARDLAAALNSRVTPRGALGCIEWVPSPDSKLLLPTGGTLRGTGDAALYVEATIGLADAALGDDEIVLRTGVLSKVRRAL